MALNNGRIKQVTQITSASTAVEANGYEAIVTTVALTTAAGASETFTINNDKVKRISQIQLTMQYSGTQGIPVARVKSQSKGLIEVMISNADAALALNALAKVHVQVVHN